MDVASHLSTTVVAYTGTSSFLNIFSEMRNPRDYKKAVIACQGWVITVYLVLGCTVYHYSGKYVASPVSWVSTPLCAPLTRQEALGSAGPLMKRIAYGIAFPGLVLGATINGHLSAKYMFVRLLKNSVHLSKNRPIHGAVWM